MLWGFFSLLISIRMRISASEFDGNLKKTTNLLKPNFSLLLCQWISVNLREMTFDFEETA